MLTIEDLRNPVRPSGFDHVGDASGEHDRAHGRQRWRAAAGGSRAERSSHTWRGKTRWSAHQAAQDYCDYINGLAVTPAKQLRSAGHDGKRAPRAVDDEAYEGALGVIRDIAAQRAGRQGYVYCITDGEFVKVGYSTNPQARVAELQTGNARPLRLLWHFAGTLQDEADMHQRHIKDNVLQEWFRPSAELSLDFFNRKEAQASA